MSGSLGRPDGTHIEVKNLSKSFGDFRAITDVSFSIEPGLMTGFLGANGAGKTTTMRMIMGLLTPDSGEVRINRCTISAADRASFGYMPEERGLYPKQPILEQLVYLGQLRGMIASVARQRATDYLTELGLGDRLKAKLESLSLGNQQRVQIVASLLHEPTALILDEPFSGLDPTAVDTMVAMLQGLMRYGVPVLFSSHQLDLVDRLCDRVVILHGGEVRAYGGADELRQQGAPRFRFVADQDAGWLRDLPQVAEGRIRVLDVNGGVALIEISKSAESKLMGHMLMQEGLSRGMREFSRVLPTLGEIYKRVSRV